MRRIFLFAVVAGAALAQALSVTTTGLPAAAKGSAYSQTLGAAGGTAPYTWSVTVGTLCGGLTLSAAGTISGTPTSLQTCPFTVKVQDSASGSATQALSIQVTAGDTSISGGGSISGAVTIK